MDFWPVQPHSLRLDARKLDHLAPFLRVFGDQLAELGGRARKHSSSKLDESRLDFRISKNRIDLLAELVEDIDGCAPGCADTKPSARLVASNKFAHRRDVRKPYSVEGDGRVLVFSLESEATAAELIELMRNQIIAGRLELTFDSPRQLTALRKERAN